MLTAKDINHKYKLYYLLYEFTKKKDYIVKQCKHLVKYDVPWLKIDNSLIVNKEGSRLEFPEEDSDNEQRPF